jgi:MFS family permease
MRLFGGWIPDRYGKKRTSVPSLLFFSISICWLGFSSNRFDLIYTGILFGLSHGLLYPSIYALVIDLAPMSDKGKAFSICSVAFTFGGMLGTIIYGSIAELYGFKIMYQMVALSCLLGFVVFSFYGREGVNGVRS